MRQALSLTIGGKKFKLENTLLLPAQSENLEFLASLSDPGKSTFHRGQIEWLHISSLPSLEYQFPSVTEVLLADAGTAAGVA